MPIATKNNQIIVKNGSVAADCACCGAWYCCNESQCVNDLISSVTASVSAFDWSYKLTVTTANCGARYAASYFNGSVANGSVSLSYDGSSAWSVVLTSCDCYIAIRYLPYFVRQRPISFYQYVLETVARLEVRANAKTKIATTSMPASNDILCSSTPSMSSSLLPDAVTSDELHSNCVEKLSSLSATYNLQPPTVSLSSDCGSSTQTIQQTGSNVVTVTVTPNY